MIDFKPLDFQPSEDEINKIDFQPIDFKPVEPEQNSFVSDTPEIQPQDSTEQPKKGNPFVRQFAGGLAEMNAGIARIPAFALDLSYLPGNAIAKLIGKSEKQAKSPDWLMNNPIAEYFDKSAKADNFIAENWKDEDFVSILKRDKLEAAEYIALQVVRNAPTQLALLASSVSGFAPQGLAFMGALSGAQTQKRHSDAGVDPLTATYDSFNSGVIEAGTEMLGTVRIFKNLLAQTVKTVGKEGAWEIIKQAGKNIFKAAAGEGSEELAAEFGQSMSSYMTNADPNALNGMGNRMIESAIIGAVSGGSMTAPMAMQQGTIESKPQKIDFQPAQAQDQEQVLEGEKPTTQVLKEYNEGVPEVIKSSTPPPQSVISNSDKKITDLIKGYYYNPSALTADEAVDNSNLVEDGIITQEQSEKLKVYLSEATPNLDEYELSAMAGFNPEQLKEYENQANVISQKILSKIKNPKESETQVKPMVFETKDGKRITIEDVKPVEQSKTEPINIESLRNNIDEKTLNLYGKKGISEASLFGEPTTEFGKNLIEKIPQEYQQLKALSLASKLIETRRDARKILNILSDRVDDNIKLEKLSDVKFESTGEELKIFNNVKEKLNKGVGGATDSTSISKIEDEGATPSQPENSLIFEESPKSSLQPAQEQAVKSAIEYIDNVTKKQGYIMPANNLYGDGSRFPGLTRKGFEAVYNDYKSIAGKPAESISNIVDTPEVEFTPKPAPATPAQTISEQPTPEVKPEELKSTNEEYIKTAQSDPYKEAERLSSYIDDNGILRTNRIKAKEIYKELISKQKPKATPQPLSVPKEDVKIRYNKYLKQAKESGFNESESIKYAKDMLSQEVKPEPKTEKPEQIEFGVEGGVDGFGQGRKGEQDLFTQEKPYTSAEKKYAAKMRVKDQQIREMEIENNPINEFLNQYSVSIEWMNNNGFSVELEGFRRNLPKNVYRKIFKNIPSSKGQLYSKLKEFNHPEMQDINDFFDKLNDYSQGEMIKPMDVYLNQARHELSFEKEQPLGGGIVHRMTQKEMEHLAKLNPDVTEGVNLKRDIVVKDIYGNTKHYKKGESIFIYQSTANGQALVKDGVYGILPKKSVEQVVQAGNKWGEFAKEKVEKIVSNGLPTAKDLVESRTVDEINKKLDKIFGTEIEMEKIDEGKLPETIKYLLSNKYRANIEYSAKVKDLPETEYLLNQVNKVSYRYGNLQESEDGKLQAGRNANNNLQSIRQEYSKKSEQSEFDFENLKVESNKVKYELENNISVMNLAVGKKVNLVDYARTPKFVLEKIGLLDEALLLERANRKYNKDIKTEIQHIKDWIARVPEKSSAISIFHYLDGRQVNLTKIEQIVADEIKTYLEDWADKLNLPADRRIAHYITHIFEQNLIEKEFDADLAKLIADRPAGSVYDPFLLERLGKKGYIEDVWIALEAYTKRAVRKYSFDPVLHRLKKAALQHPLENSKFITRLINRVNMRPTEFDNLVDNFVKSVIGYKLGQRPTNVITNTIRKIIYRGALGLNVSSAIRNIGQGANTYAELGEKYTVIGYYDLLTKGIGEVVEVGVMDDTMVKDESLSSLEKTMENIDGVLFKMFQVAEQINRGAAYYGAKARAIEEGKTLDEAILAGINIVGKTQFRFGSIDSPLALSSDVAKTLMVLRTFDVKQSEFLINKIKNKEFIGLLRWIAATIFVYATIGKALGWAWKNIIPSIGFGMPGADVVMAIIKLIGAETEGVKKKAIQTIIRSSALFIPAGVQGRKTVTGLIDYLKGYTSTASDNVRTPISESVLNAAKSILFGSYTTKESLRSKSLDSKPLGAKQSERLKSLTPEQRESYYNRIIEQRKRDKFLRERRSQRRN